MDRLHGKIAIVTGGAGGIGLATAKLFAKEGASVLLVDLKESALQKATATIDSENVSYVTADVTQAEQVKQYVHTAVERYGGIDILINNAGILGEMSLIPNYPIEMYDKVMAVNVRGVWLGLKYAIPEIAKRGGGSIVLTSSMAGISGALSNAPYAASKHAVVGLMRSAASECASQGIRVNSVNPGLIQTDMTDLIADHLTPGDREQTRQTFNANIPLQRYGTAEEVAQMMLFLASDESSYCTGGVYTIDGGIAKRQ